MSLAPWAYKNLEGNSIYELFDVKNIKRNSEEADKSLLDAGLISKEMAGKSFLEKLKIKHRDLSNAFEREKSEMTPSNMSDFQKIILDLELQIARENEIEVRIIKETEKIRKELQKESENWYSLQAANVREANRQILETKEIEKLSLQAEINALKTIIKN